MDGLDVLFEDSPLEPDDIWPKVRGKVVEVTMDNFRKCP